MTPKKKTNNSNNIIVLIVLIVSILTISLGVTYKFFKEKNKQEESAKQKEEAQTVPVIGIYDVYKKLDNKEDFVLLDARDKEDFEKEHIPTSTNIPYEELEGGRYHELPQNKTIVVTCYGEGCLTSKQAALFLKKEGFEKLYDMAAGISGWKSAKLPTIESGNLENPTNFYKSIAIDSANLDEIIENYKDEIIIVDLRSEIDYSQDHLPDAVWIPFEKLESEYSEKLLPTKKIILYSDDDTESQKASVTLYDLDFPLTFYLSGGYNSWKTYTEEKSQEEKTEEINTETP